MRARGSLSAATSPSSVWVGGMRMSTIATSGRSRRRAASSSSASAACAARPRSPPRRAAAPALRAGATCRRRSRPARDLRVIARAAARRALDREAAVERSDPVGEPAQARSRRRVRAADAVVARSRRRRVPSLPADATPRRGARRECLRDVRERLGDDEVGGRLDLPRASGRRRRRRPRPATRRASASVRTAAPRPWSTSTAGWMPRASSRSSASACVQLLLGSRRAARPPRRLRRPGARSELQRHPEAEQPLLGAVVEVALEPPPLVVAGLDDPRPRGAKLRELGAQLGLQPLVLEREPRCRARQHRASPAGRRIRVVHDRCELVADQVTAAVGVSPTATSSPCSSAQAPPAPAARARARGSGRRSRARVRHGRRPARAPPARRRAARRALGRAVSR